MLFGSSFLVFHKSWPGFEHVQGPKAAQTIVRNKNMGFGPQMARAQCHQVQQFSATGLSKSNQDTALFQQPTGCDTLAICFRDETKCSAIAAAFLQAPLTSWNDASCRLKTQQKFQNQFSCQSHSIAWNELGILAWRDLSA